MKTSCESCGSSDGKHVYEDHSHCYVCGEQEWPKQKEEVDDNANESVNDIYRYPSYPISSRGISRSVVDHFRVRMAVTPEGEPAAHYYPYTRSGSTVAYKVRELPKTFSTVGDFKGIELFGQVNSSGSHTLVICEGEVDALSVAEAWQRTGKPIYPVVALPSSTAKTVALQQRDFINGFDKVILFMDSDDAGKKATEDLAKIIKAGKCYIATLPENDVNDTLMKHGPGPIIKAIWGAREWSPAGIVMGEEIWEQFKARQETESVPYPDCLKGLNSKLKGIRHGEITLFTSGTGSGKSTVIKEIVLDLLDKTSEKIGLISLEESVGDTAEKFISMSLHRNVMDPPPLNQEEIRLGFDNVFGDERLVLLDHQGSASDASLLDKIEYMALMGCKYLVLDHITIAVSEGADGLTGNEAIDKMMSDLLKVVKKHNVWLGLISHLRKTSGGRPFEEGNLAGMDDIKGSGSIKQISFDIISFSRNLVAEDEQERNTINFRVLKSRFTGRTGEAGAAIYDPHTTRLGSTINIDFEGF